MQAAYKFGWIPDEEQRYEYPNIFAVEKTKGPDRLVIAPSAYHISLMLDLVQIMAEPLGILYILAVPRGGGNAGRYQKATFASLTETADFMNHFKDFFENDARHHLWVKSMSGADMLVYDNHNVIYAYGPLPDFQRVLVSRGLEKVDQVKFPSPHTHKYNQMFDDAEQQVLCYWEWKHTPLRPEDD